MVENTRTNESKKLKPSWLYNQACAVPYQISDGMVEVVLVTSRRKRDFIFPKGVIERNQTPAETAVQEAYEEAGVKGTVTAELTTITYPKWNSMCTANVFALKVSDVLENWPEKEKRDRIIVSVEDASTLINRPEMEAALRAFKEWMCCSFE